jgi:hypothetical protein
MNAGPIQLLDEPSPEGHPRRSAQRQFVTASAIGGGVGLLMLLAVLSRGFTSLTTTSFGSNFYDAQAQAFLKGRFWVPSQVASLEGIHVRGHTYLYFGPFLAFLRLPIVWLWPQVTGPLTQSSMFLGACVLLVGVAHLGWNVRVLLRGEGQLLSRAEQVGQAGFLAAVAGCSVVLYLVGSPSVYYETELWGAALALTSIACFTWYLRTRSTTSATLLCLAALFDALTRNSVAIGPILLVVGALGLSVWHFTRGTAGSEDQPIAPGTRWRHLVLLSTGTLGVVGLPVAINWIKFRTILSVPWNRQFVALHTPAVADFYRHHGIVSLANLSSTLGWYFRPTAVATTGLFPFFRYTSHVAVSGHAAFLSAERSSSIPASMPLFTILSLVGLLIAVAPRLGGVTLSARSRWAVRSAVVGSLASGLVILIFDTIANRYIADLLPFLITCSVVGFTWIVGRWQLLPMLVRGALVLASVVLAVFSLLVNLSLGLEDALVFGPSPTPQQRAALVHLQLSIHQLLPIALRFPASTGTQLPAHPVDSQLFVQEHCAGVYQYNSPLWNQLEVGAPGGRRVLDIRLPINHKTVTQPLLVAGSEQGSFQFFAIEYTPAGRYRLVYESQPWNRSAGQVVVVYAQWRQVSPHRNLRVDLSIPVEAPNGGGYEEASIAGSMTFYPQLPVVHTSTLSVGRFPHGQAAFSGLLVSERVPTPLCTLALSAIKSSGQ